ncbi:MAG TPA: hypothetical protein VLL97_00225 [Acidobacteriota bacterium]|nr:hypothetical protein [Acidobacteriota bacterium]
MLQFVLTPAAGKRLIAKGIAAHAAVQAALKSATVVIVAGTTNGYVAEEVLKMLGREEGFCKDHFFRGITLPRFQPTADMGRLPDERMFPGDVVLVKGSWNKGKTIYDVLDSLKEGDVILKGANAVDLFTRRAAVLIGHPTGGTVIAALQAVAGRRVRLIIPAGVEKRVSGDLDDLAAVMNAPCVEGPRLLPVPGELFTEIDAISLITGCSADLVAAGGVCGAEGAAWFAVSGDTEQEQSARHLLQSVAGEPPFSLY